MTIGYKFSVRERPNEVIWQITKGELKTIRVVDESKFQLAENHMKTLRSKGIIQGYVLEASELRSIPDLIAFGVIDHLADDYVFRFVIARGYALYPELMVEKSVYDHAAVDVSVQGDLTGLSDWTVYDLVYGIRHKAREIGAAIPGIGHCELVYQRLMRGKKVRFLPLRKEQDVESTESGFSTFLSPDANGLIIALTNPHIITHPQLRKQLLNEVIVVAEETARHYKFKLEKEAILERLRQAARQKYALGLGLPITIFAGYCEELPTTELVKANKPPRRVDKPRSLKSKMDPVSQTRSEIEIGKSAPQKGQVKDSDNSKASQSKSSPSSNYPGKGLLELAVTPDNREAAIKNFREVWFQNPEYSFDEAWLESELSRLKIALRQEKLLSRVLENLKRKKDVNQLSVAMAEEGEAPSDPYLVNLIEGEMGSSETPSPSGQQKKDMRQSVIHVVKSNTRVAAWHFHKPGLGGRDVFGGALAPPAPTLPQLNLGAGVEQDMNWGYRSKIDGLVVMDIGSHFLDVQKHYQIQGDVSLSTGNIYFDGAVTVKGSVRDQATIICTQNLIVEGGVAFATLYSGGDIQIKGGLVNGTVTSKGKVQVGFVENSKVVCTKELIALKSVMNSDVVASQVFCTGDPGLIAGGSIYCLNRVLANSIGFINNAKTTILLGVDFNYCRRVALNERRTQRSRDFLESKNKELQTFKGKSEAQLTSAHKESIRSLKSAIKRAKKINETLEGRRAHLKVDQPEINSNADCIVLGTLQVDVDIMLGKEKVKVIGGASQGVWVSFKKRNESFIRALPEEVTVSESYEVLGLSRTGNEPVNVDIPLSPKKAPKKAV